MQYPVSDMLFHLIYCLLPRYVLVAEGCMVPYAPNVINGSTNYCKYDLVLYFGGSNLEW